MTTPHLQDDDLVLHYYGEMPAGSERDAEAHLAACGECQVNYAKLQRVMAYVDSAPAADAPPGFDTEMAITDSVVHEIDVVRVVTFVAVVAVHATGGTTDQQSVGGNAALTLLHFTREAFFALTGFVLFRLADQLKPWPARSAERNLPGGWGIMLDDLCAAAWAVVMVLLARASGVLT